MKKVCLIGKFDKKLTMPTIGLHAHAHGSIYMYFYYCLNKEARRRKKRTYILAEINILGETKV